MDKCGHPHQAAQLAPDNTLFRCVCQLRISWWEPLRLRLRDLEELTRADDHLWQFVLLARLHNIPIAQIDEPGGLEPRRHLPMAGQRIVLTVEKENPRLRDNVPAGASMVHVHTALRVKYW